MNQVSVWMSWGIWGRLVLAYGKCNVSVPPLTGLLEAFMSYMVSHLMPVVGGACNPITGWD